MTKTETRERPILFNGEMVRAILDGRKTQTRREVKPQPTRGLFHLECLPDGEWRDEEVSLGRCPFGIPGDRLYVRETWTLGEVRGDDAVSIIYRASNDLRPNGVSYEDFGSGRWFTRPQEEVDLYRNEMDRLEVVGNGSNWKPSIHMPKWASRITLEITNVRVERLHSISAKDIIAEGAVLRPHHDQYLGKMPVSAFDKKAYPDLRSLWAHGWNGIYKNWKDNPYVWVVEFKRVQFTATSPT